METFIHALVLSLCLEGICFALFPVATRKALLETAAYTDDGLRATGGAFIALALVLLFGLRLFG